ncbi:hypothetical protein [Aquamicrobium sp. LC103]|uniref:hypothetical protein n=1 Tax=Aquamicrobium sp. LC103 TaxID=1120658 RepID=UPI00109D5469|nr:hypothetical protein [Aquamicrobium sp. LC103]TKT82679.1 hypothetical protein XW59_001585 [Aquamicrobium sp. LC103]
MAFPIRRLIRLLLAGHHQRFAFFKAAPRKPNDQARSSRRAEVAAQSICAAKLADPFRNATKFVSFRRGQAQPFAAETV